MKQRSLKVAVGLALVLTLAGVSGIVADSLGLSTTAQVYACGGSGSGGGGC
jgi:hypothetical protein